MSKRLFWMAFAIGLVTVAWVALGFVGSSWLALAMTAVIGAVFLLGAFELRQFRAATAGLSSALADIAQPLASLGDWLEQVPPALRNAVRLRIEGERAGLPGPALTPYLVGLLVMLGMLGTFLGMVITFKGAVFALEGSTDLNAIRSALAEPIRGLGLSFGTSVAGVAASAMLGLMSAISRRERMDAGRRLDGRIATVLRPFSLAHQRHETFRALQAQATALPEVVDKLDAMMERIEQRSRQLDEQLMERQHGLHRDVTIAYTALADAVGASLQDSLAAGARAAGESITPIVESAMARIAQDAQRLHEHVGEALQKQAGRDNLALQERTALLQRLGAVMDTLEAQSGKASDMAVHVSGSALELASLGEAFGHGVQLFQASNDKLVEGLQRIEASLTRSTERSDEQLAYYVAQAREVIDLSIASQQGMVDKLRLLPAKPAAVAEGARG